MTQESWSKDGAEQEHWSPPDFDRPLHERPSGSRSSPPPPLSPQPRSKPYSAESSSQISRSINGEPFHQRQGRKRTWNCVLQDFLIEPTELSQLSPFEAGLFVRSSQPLSNPIRKHEKKLAIAFVKRRQDGGKTPLVSYLLSLKRKISVLLMIQLSSANHPLTPLPPFPGTRTLLHKSRCHTAWEIQIPSIRDRMVISPKFARLMVFEKQFEER